MKEFDFKKAGRVNFVIKIHSLRFSYSIYITVLCVDVFNPVYI